MRIHGQQSSPSNLSQMARFRPLLALFLIALALEPVLSFDPSLDPSLLEKITGDSEEHASSVEAVARAAGQAFPSLWWHMPILGPTPGAFSRTLRALKASLDSGGGMEDIVSDGHSSQLSFELPGELRAASTPRPDDGGVLIVAFPTSRGCREDRRGQGTAALETHVRAPGCACLDDDDEKLRMCVRIACEEASPVWRAWLWPLPFSPGEGVCSGMSAAHVPLGGSVCDKKGSVVSDSNVTSGQKALAALLRFHSAGTPRPGYATCVSKEASDAEAVLKAGRSHMNVYEQGSACSGKPVLHTSFQALQAKLDTCLLDAPPESPSPKPPAATAGGNSGSHIVECADEQGKEPTIHFTAYGDAACIEHVSQSEAGAATEATLSIDRTIDSGGRNGTTLLDESSCFRDQSFSGMGDGNEGVCDKTPEKLFGDYTADDLKKMAIQLFAVVLVLLCLFAIVRAVSSMISKGK